MQQCICDLPRQIPFMQYVTVAPLKCTFQINLNQKAIETEKDIKVVKLTKARLWQQ